MGIKLSPAGRRLATIIVATPFMVTTSWILYKRVVLGEERITADGKPLRPMGVKAREDPVVVSNNR
ncbi:uncharacterized protein BYT42DRAFT_646748 [Radiomyces spectabilis]|uniref:uncharacterized protein n=1 Tax=Radiomyces spectabilis TaxID=64574 RepID=UPI00221F1B47|nr:uncharacterized protein BYT42DRAFT_646748 [Radiomyces spectabilis]KAI8372761.1 hypothetical protein BYT42DRAFT_646748 [Radiomyces spectabilis]